MALFSSYNLVKKIYTGPCFLLTIYPKENKTLFNDKNLKSGG